MLCEEQGYFLEIADIIRGFGLNILKGRMEVRENKIWARFIVEVSVEIMIQRTALHRIYLSKNYVLKLSFMFSANQTY